MYFCCKQLIYVQSKSKNRLSFQKTIWRRPKALIDEKSRLTTAKRIGMEKGILEGKKTMAKELKKNGIPFDIIAKTSGLSIEEIEKL